MKPAPAILVIARPCRLADVPLRLPRLPTRAPLPTLIALALCAWGQAWAQQQQAATEEGLRLRGSRVLGAPAKSSAKPAVAISAGKLTAQPEQDAEASGDVELRYGEVLVNADKLNYRVADDFARAEGNVRINHRGNIFTGPLLQLYVSRRRIPEPELLSASHRWRRQGGGSEVPGQRAPQRHTGQLQQLPGGRERGAGLADHGQRAPPGPGRQRGPG